MKSLMLDRRFTMLWVAFLALPLSSAEVARGNGLIISPVHDRPIVRPGPNRRPVHKWLPFRIRSQSVEVEINDAVAETRVEQVFYNQSGRQIEGTYLFPIAPDAGVRTFSMWMNGREISAELLDADRARRIYQDIVSRMRDPALLQFAGRGLIQAKVFPIPPGGECRIKLRYSEPVRVDSGLGSYRFPLGITGCRFQPIERFSLRAVVRSSRPLASVFSPSHECRVERRSDREMVVSLEKARLQPEEDFQLHYGFGSDAFGLSLLTHRTRGEDGFFMARITPNLGVDADGVLPKNICFVLDTSGSMAESNKIAQAKKALAFCITNLGKEDRFNILSFATEVRSFREGWTVADEAAKSAARNFIDGLGAVGGTDIDSALKRALSLNPTNGHSHGDGSWRKNPYMVVFITDGEPTVGVTDPARIIKNVAGANRKRDARIFVLGVGFQVNTKLLDRLADDNGGARGYVTPNEDLELKISSFYTKLASPVLAQLKLAFDGVSVHDIFPRQLPDLFRGSELVVVGRYGRCAGDGQKIGLTGSSRGATRGYHFDCDFPDRQERHEFLPRVWAMRKIGYLLDELRLHGDSRELKNEVIRLSKQYGILTPYTSFLVQEEDRVARQEQRMPVGGRRLSALGYLAEEEQAEVAAAPMAQDAESGEASVGASQSNFAMRGAAARKTASLLKDVQTRNRSKSGQQLINLIGRRTFYFEEDRWVDADYDGKAETTRLVVYSQAYNDFLAANPEAGRYLAQGDRVVINWRGRIYESVPENSSN